MGGIRCYDCDPVLFAPKTGNVIEGIEYLHSTMCS